MCAQTVSELLVKVSPQGLSETRDEMEGVQEEFSETAKVASEETSTLEDFSNRWTGAMAVVISGLAVASAGLLSQVPVIGEVMAGLFSIIDSLAFRIDGVLRPVLQPLTDAFFEVSNAIMNAEGWVGAIIDILATAAVIAPFVAAIGLIAANFGLIASVVGTVIAVLTGPLALAVIAISLLIAGLLVAWKNNWFGIRDITNSIISTVREVITGFVNFIKPFWENFVSAVLAGNWGEALLTIFNLAKTVWASVAELVIGFVGDILQVIVRWSNNIIERIQKFSNRLQVAFQTLFDLIINGAKAWANRFVNIIETAVNKAVRATPDLIRSELGLSTVNISDPFRVQSTGSILAGARQRVNRMNRDASMRSAVRTNEQERQIERLIAAMETTTTETILNLDGREIANVVENLIGSGAVNVGATGVRR